MSCVRRLRNGGEGMNILCIDTTGPVAGAALMQDGAITHEITASHGLTHSETSLPMVDDILSAAGIEPKDIDLFAAVAGPGSFTGVRIGVCTVKGLAHAWNKPVVAVSSLEALATGAFGFDGVICPILDARRAQVYAAAYRFREGELPVEVLPMQAVALDEFAAQLPQGERLLFLGDGLRVHFPRLRELLGERAVAAPAHQCYLRAAAGCYLAEKRSAEAVPSHALEPVYLRLSQAERERREREAQ